MGLLRAVQLFHARTSSSVGLVCRCVPGQVPTTEKLGKKIHPLLALKCTLPLGPSSSSTTPKYHVFKLLLLPSEALTIVAPLDYP